MHCEHAEEQIQRALDAPDALSADERRALDAHLHACAACRRAQGEYRRLHQITGDWVRRAAPAAASDDAFAAAVLARIAAADAAATTVTRRPAAAPSTWRLSAALVATLLVAAWALWPFAASRGPLAEVASAVTTIVAAPDRVATDVRRPTLPSVPEAETLRQAPADVAESLRALPDRTRRAWYDALRAVGETGVAASLSLPALWATLAAVAALLNAGFFVRAARQNRRDLAG